MICFYMFGALALAAIVCATGMFLLICRAAHYHALLTDYPEKITPIKKKRKQCTSKAK